MEQTIIDRDLHGEDGVHGVARDREPRSQPRRAHMIVHYELEAMR
jgi:hypothetical protein